MIRVLHVFHNMGNGGIENFVMNYYRAVDKTKLQFDFLTSVEESGFFDDEIRSMGGKIYHAYPKRKNLIRNLRDITKIVKENNYTIVHRHTGSSIANMDLLAAKVGKAKTLIAHSHSTSAGKKWLHYIARFLFNVQCEKYACSKAAGEWLFGRKKEFQIIKNAINTGKFRFNGEKRDILRKEYLVANKKVIGHVGNFNEAKNHEFIIEVFNKIQKLDENVVLWLIGDGKLKNNIEKKVNDLMIRDKVVFWGNRQDVADLMQAMDIFLFPSVYEGYPVTLIEAQTCGLPCFVSDQVIPSEVNVSGKVFYINLNLSGVQWAEVILEHEIEEGREDEYMKVKQAGFDICDSAKELERRYFEYAER